MGLLIHGCPRTPPDVRHPKSDSSRTPPERWPHEWPEWAMRLLLKVLVSPKWTPRQIFVHLNRTPQSLFIAAQCFFLAVQCFSVAVQSFTPFCVLRCKTNIYGGQISCTAISFVAMQGFGACYAKYCTATFFCCTRLLHCKLYLLHCSVLLFYTSSSTFSGSNLNPQRWVLEGFRKSPQGILEGAGGVLLTTMNQVYLASW